MTIRQSLYDFCTEHGHSILLAQWDGEKNAPLSPKDISYGSRQKVWWRCVNGHSWQAGVYSRSAGSGCPYCTGRLPLPGVNTLVERAPALVEEWDVEKNAPLTSADVTVGSHRLIWWRCEKGHSYRSAVKTRIQGSSCPYCAGRAVLPEENSLAARYPALTAEWDVEKNAPLTPEQVLAGTRRKVWWRCPKGHSWQTSILSRTKLTTGCPYCNGHAVLSGVNDLAALYPSLISEWDWEKNGSLSPETLRPYSNRRVWWCCPLGHSYAAVIAARTTRKCGCPYCAGRKVFAGFNDLETKAPAVSAQWHPTLNAPLTTQQVTYGSNRKVWWICPLGHVWKATIASRTGKQQCGCPVCAGRTIDKYPTAGSRRVNI